MAFFESVTIPGIFLLYGFLSLFLLTKGKPTRRDIYALGLLLVLLIPVLQKELVSAIKPIPGNYLYLRELSPLLVSPLLYFYTKSLIQPHADRKLEIAIHVLPFFIAIFLLVSPFLHQYRFVAATPTYLPMNTQQSSRPPILLIISGMGGASFFVYGFRLFSLLKSRKRALEDYFSFISADLRLFWIQELLLGLGVVQIYLLIATAAAVSGFRHRLLNPSEALNIGYSLYFLFFAYFSLRQDRILFKYDMLSDNASFAESRNKLASEGDPDVAIVAVADDPDATGASKYKKSGLDLGQLQRILDKVTQLVEGERLFRQCDLTLDHIALRTGISRHYISQALNEIAGKNFYAWVNLFRAKDLRTSLENRAIDHLSILVLAGRSGFNSKSSFISYFKQLAGQSPSQYRKNHQSASAGSSLSGETTDK